MGGAESIKIVDAVVVEPPHGGVVDKVDVLRFRHFEE
jgi:hypothetical protein